MAKMQFAVEDRPHVKPQCARMLANLRIDPARSSLIWGFMNAYLKLTASELIVYNQDMRTFEPEDQSLVLEIENEWTAKGRAEGEAAGRAQGQARAVSRILARRFGSLPSEVSGAIAQLNSEQLDGLIESLLDFTSVADLQAWLAHR